MVIWARLYLDLEPYLAIRKADGAELIGFYHRQVTEVAQADYGSPSHHARLAAYFTPQPLYLDLNALALNLHKLSEMVYQQACAGLASQVEKALLDYFYLNLAGINSEDDFDNIRLNEEEMEKTLDREKFFKYLEVFGVKKMEKWVRRCLH